jgi:chromate transporter
VTWFTFLPSFLFILGGGPLVESTRRDVKFTAPLTAITAAVVGVVLNLALFFAIHLLWPQGLNEPLNLQGGLLALAAGAALFRYKFSVMQVLGVCAAVGVVFRLLNG